MLEPFNFLYPAIQNNDYQQILNQLEVFYSSYDPGSNEEMNEVLVDLCLLINELISQESIHLKPLQAIFQFLHSWGKDSIEKEGIQSLFSVSLVEQNKLDLVIPFLMGELATPALLMAAAIENKNEKMIDDLYSLPGFFILKENQINLSCLVYAQDDLNFIHNYEKIFPFDEFSQEIAQKEDYIELLYINCLKAQSTEHIEYLKQVHKLDLLGSENKLMMVSSSLDIDFRKMSLDKQIEFFNYFNHNLTDKPNEQVMSYLFDIYLGRLIMYTEEKQLFTDLLATNDKYQWFNVNTVLDKLKRNKHLLGKESFIEHYEIYLEKKQLDDSIKNEYHNEDSKNKMKL